MRQCFLAAAAVCLLPFAGLTPGSVAAPATQDGARSLQTVFETYLGKPAAGTAGAVRVSPNGERYKIVFDLQTLAKPLQALGVVVAMKPYELFATLDSGGLWKVTAGEFPPLNIGAKSQTIALSFSGHKFSGTFDPKIKGFILGTQNISELRMISLAPGMENERVDGPTSTTMTAVRSGPGTISAVIQQTTASSQQTFRLTKGKSAKPAMEFSVKLGQMSMNFVADQLKNDSFLGLWAFAVANPSAEQIMGKFEELRVLLKGALPIFNTLNQSVKAKNLSVGTPLGEFKVASMDGGMDMAGIRPKGHFGFKMAFDGFTIPASVSNGMLPPWSKGLLPKKATLDVSVSGFNLAAAANEILAKFDPQQSKAQTQALFKRAGLMVAPGARVNVKIGPTRIVTDLLALEVSGNLDVMKPMPKGKITARAKGLDETIKALQPFVAKDKNLQKAMLGMIAAKGFGKALPDGRLEWVIEIDPAGTASVNGFKVPLPGRMRGRK